MSTGEERSFARELGLEWACAVSASFTVAPIISIVDRSIIENASGKTPLLEGLKNGFKHLILKPWNFAKQPAFLLIWGVYAGTYITGNTIDLICKRNQHSPYVPKFIGSSIANVGLSVGKDRIYTQMFGSQKVKQPFPPASFGLFATRDSLTILAGFILPGMISTQVQEKLGWKKQMADVTCQLVVPCAMQFISCPMHLLGIDLYNRPGISGQERIVLVKREYWKTAWARVSRIFPAYGIGGVLNKELRKRFSLTF